MQNVREQVEEADRRDREWRESTKWAGVQEWTSTLNSIDKQKKDSFRAKATDDTNHRQSEALRLEQSSRF